MKIGMVIDNYPPEIGGAQTHVFYLSQVLGRLEYDVSSYTKIPHGPGIKDLANFIRSVDIVHCHYTDYLTCLSCLVAKLMKRPRVITLHGRGTLDSSVGNSHHRRIYRWASLKLADAVIGTSEEISEIARRFTRAEKIYTIPNGVDTDYFKPLNGRKKDSDGLIVLSARRLHPKNGVQYLVEAIPYIIKQLKRPVEFWIMGKAKLEGYLKARAEELGVKDIVKFIGEVPNEATRDYYNMADVVVFPSSAETTSIACLEAMAMAKGIVASSLKSYKELLGLNERGILVELFDRDYSDYNAPLFLPKYRVKGLANAVITILRDSDLRRKLGEAGREYVVANYDWRLIVDRVSSIYAQIIAGGR